MSRDATALGLPPITLGGFLEILWDLGDLDLLALTPAESLTEIRGALSAGDLPATWTRIQHERRLVGAVLTHMRYLSPEERAHSSDISVFVRYAVELNGLAGIAALQAGQVWSARELWLCGVAAWPEADPLRAALRDPEFEGRLGERPVPEGLDAQALATMVAQDRVQMQRGIERAGSNLAAAVLTDEVAAVVGFATTTVILPPDVFVASIVSGRGLPQEALALGSRQAVKELLAAGPSLALAESLLTLARSLRTYEDALAITDAIALAVQIMRRIGHQRGLGRALLDLGVNFKDHRLWYDALRALELADGHFAATRDRGGLAAAAYQRATIARHLDESGTALAFLDDARRLLPAAPAADGWRMQLRSEELLNLMHLDRRSAARALIDEWVADSERHERAGGRPLLLSRALAALADLDRRDGDRDAALASYDRACMHAAREILDHRTVGFRDQERIRAADVFAPAIRCAIDFGATDMCFGMLQLARTGSLSLSTPRRTESTMATLRERDEHEELSHIVERAIEATRAGTGLAAVQHEARWLIGRRDFVEAAVPESPAASARGGSAALAHAVRRRLEPATAVIEYFWSFDALFVLVLDRDGATVHDLGMTRIEVTGLVEAALGELEAAEGSVHLAMLAHALVDPIDARLASCSTLFLVPAEGLHRVPFHALERGARPLVTTHLLRYLDRAAVLASDRPSSPRPILSTSECRALGAPTVGYAELPALDNVPPELRLVAAMFRAAPNLAAESDDLLAASSAEVIHVACHAEAQPEAPLLSRLLLADRPVFAFEIALSAFNAGLVVLSACDTGSGPAAAGGRTHSLASAFLGAGAREVAASLWPLVDEVGPVFIEQFYSAMLKRRASAAEAVRAAQLAVRRMPEFAHPSYWAPFVVYGA